MTPQDIIDEASTFLPDTSDAFPVPDWVKFQRINARQRQLFAMAGEWDQEFFGKRVKVTLDNSGCADLTRVEAQGESPIERIDRIELCGLSPANPHGYDLGDKVTVCKARERHQHAQPRVLVRSKILETVEERNAEGELVKDLEAGAELRIWYTKRPRTIDGQGKVKLGRGLDPVERDVEIGDPWEWLLVWDLVKSLVGRTAADDAEKKNPVWTLAHGFEKELLMTFQKHVTGFSSATETITD